MKTKVSIPDLTNNDGSISRDDLDKANILVNFFSSVFSKENVNNIPIVNDNRYRQLKFNN